MGLKSHRRDFSSRRRWLSWINLRKAVQYLTLLGFLALVLATRQGGWDPDLVNLPMRLDPLAALANLLASRTFLAGSALALLVVLLTLIAGRAWCGWLCPLGTVLDLFPLQGKRGSKGPGADRLVALEAWRSVKYALLLTIVFAALLGVLTLLIFDPLTLLVRSLAVAILPALDRLVTALEVALYRFPVMEGALVAVDGWLRPAVLPYDPVYYRNAWLIAAVFVGVIALNLVAPRFWCRYLCPLGGLLGLVSKFALLRRQVGSECKACTLCTRACPTGTVNPEQGYASDPAECSLCLECLEVCPRQGIHFFVAPPAPVWNGYDPNRRQALAAFGAGLAALALFRSDAIVKREMPHMLRPPGGRENDLLAKCIRCGECLKACPTGGLQPAWEEAGVEGVWSPVLVPRLGYCDISCNLCGQVCPVEAIPALTLEEKRLQVIGKAYLDQDRCLAWADGQPCIVCEEMCPLPEKAIRLREEEQENALGEMNLIQLPYVLREGCVGCGICEYKCPVNGEAAIRVFVPEAEVTY